MQFIFKVLIKHFFCSKIIFCLICSVIIFNNKVLAQDDFDVIKNWHQYKNVPNALYDYLSMQAYDLLDERKEIVEELHSLDEWKARQEWIEETLLDLVGPFPEKTPLNAKVLNIVEKKDFKVENIVYESQPGFYVTSSLFIPNGIKKDKQTPTIIFCSGHSKTAYRAKFYQKAILNFVKKGFIVFAFDPIGQGERMQYYNPQIGKSLVGDGSTREHSYISAQTFIIGSSLGRYMIWDGIRAVDYLTTREEVNIKKIGIAGMSGGGFQSAYIASFDKRIYASAPGNHITNYTKMLQSIGPRDGEQNLIQMFSRGIDHADFLTVRAPKPCLMVTTTNDYFNIQGARETAQEVSGIYDEYNMKENISMVEDIAKHEYTKKNREAMYAFFQKHLNNNGNSSDEEIELLTEEELRVTATGQVSTSYINNETVYSLNRKEAEKLNVKLKYSRKNLNKHQSTVIKYAEELSGYKSPIGVPEPVLTGSLQRDGYLIEKYFIKGEGNYPIPYLLMVPDIKNNKAVIYLHPSGKSAEAIEDGDIEEFVKNGFIVLVPDIIGTGETGPGDWKGGNYFDNFYNRSLNYQVWYASILIGRSIVGIRASDVNRLAEVLMNDNKKTEEIYAVATQEMSPVLLHAAAFDPIISRIALIEPFSSYRSIVMSRYYSPNFIANAVAGSLRYYDLPDLAASLAPRKLFIFNPTDGVGQNDDNQITKEDISIIKSGYNYQGAEKNVTIKYGILKKELFEFLLE